MFSPRHFLVFLACLTPLLASAQWQWIDKDGRKVYSDRAPPSDVPEKNILRQPGGSRLGPLPGVSQTSGAANPGGAASAPEAAASVPKKFAQGDEEAKQKAAADKVKSQNCERARNSQSVMKSGIRLRVPNAKGEVEYISDEERASEIQRLQGIIDSECK